MSVLFLPSSVLFLAVTVFSGFLAMSSTSWVFVFAGLVLNTVAVLPNLIQLSMFSWKSGEGAGKYFLVQAKASTAYALGSAMYWHWDVTGAKFMGMAPSSWGLVFLLTSLFIKLGMYPFYAWVPGVVLGISWSNCWLILTWQKYFPLVLYLQVFCAEAGEALLGGCVVLSVCLTAFLGGFLGLGHTSLRSLVAYSSLVHSSWGLMAASLGVQTVSLYMLIYSLVLGSVVYLFSQVGVRSAQDPLMVGGSGASPFLAGPLVVSVLSLGGMPPLAGFVGKWLVMSQWGALSLSALPLGACLVGSFVSLGFYLSICWGSFWRASADTLVLGDGRGFWSGVVFLVVNTGPAVYGILLVSGFW